MNGDEKIVSAIVSEALAYADGVTVKANSTALEITTKAQKEAQEVIDGAKIEAEKYADAIIKNKRTLISIENKKSALALKREILDNVYLKTLEKLNALSKKDYLTLVEKIIKKYAEKGEEISISKNAPIKEEDVSELEVVKKLSLKVKKDGDYLGGIVIKSDLYDKRFTFDAIVSELREKTEGKLSAQLFD